MTLDDIAQQATTDVIDRSTPTAPSRLADLKATRARRSRLGAAAIAAALTVAVALGSQLLAADERHTQPPADSVRNGALVILKGQGPSCSIRVEA